MDKTIYLYTRRTFNDHGYPQTEFRVWQAAPSELQCLYERLAGTVDNRDGYGSAEGAARVQRQTAALLHDGFRRRFEPAWSTTSVTFTWQHYGSDGSYCSARTEFDTNLRHVDAGYKLLSKVRSACAKIDRSWAEHPSHLETWLGKVKAAELIRVQAGDDHWSTELCPKSERCAAVAELPVLDAKVEVAA